jgi:hypothetical protein
VAGDFSIAQASGNTTALTINRAALTLTVGSNGIAKEYDGTSKAFLTSNPNGYLVTNGGIKQTVAQNVTVSGWVTGQGATLNVNNGTYSTGSSPNVGSSYSVSASILASSFANLVGSTSMSNYQIGTVQLINGNSYAFSSSSGVINPAPLGVAISNAPSKVYDGTNTATLGSTNMSFTGLVTGQGISLGTTPSNAYYTASSTNPTKVSNVGSGYGVTANVAYSDFSTSGGATLSNYSIGGVQIVSGKCFTVSASGGAITPATLNATATAASMTYGSSAPALSGTISSPTITSTTSPSLSSLVTATSWSTSATRTSNVGSYSITPVLSYGTNLDGTSVVAGDFTLVSASGNATAMSVTPAPLTVSLSPVNKTYDGSSNAYAVGQATLETVNGVTQSLSPNVTLSGFLNGNSATFTTATGSYLSGGSSVANVGNGYTVSIPVGAGSFSAGSGTLLSNYSVNGVQLTGTNSATVSGTGSISPLSLSLGSTASKTADGGAAIVLNASNTTISGMPTGQSASLAGNVSGTLSAASVGSDLGGTVALVSGDLTGNGSFLSALSAGDYILPTAFTGGSILSLSSSAIIPVAQVSSSVELASQATTGPSDSGNEVAPLPALVAPSFGSFGASLGGGGGLSLGDLSDDSSTIFDMSSANTTYKSRSKDQTVLAVDSGTIQPVESKAVTVSRSGNGGGDSGVITLDGQAKNVKSQSVEVAHSLTLAGSASAPYSLQVPTFHGSGNGVFESSESQ